MTINQDKESVRQMIMGFTEMFKGITENQDLKIPDEIADKFGLNSDGTVVKELKEN